MLVKMLIRIMSWLLHHQMGEASDDYMLLKVDKFIVNVCRQVCTFKDVCYYLLFKLILDSLFLQNLLYGQFYFTSFSYSLECRRNRNCGELWIEYSLGFKGLIIAPSNQGHNKFKLTLI